MGTILDRYRKACYKVTWKMQNIIAPSLRFSQYIYEDVLKDNIKDGTKWLDLGCGHRILPSWRSEEEKKLVKKCGMIVGVDYDMDSLKKHPNILRKIRSDISMLPFKDNYFDIVTANMVVEHLSDPETQFKEIYRILKPGGMFIFHTPNNLGYSTIVAKCIPESIKDRMVYIFQGRKEEDVFKTYYRANTQKSIISLATLSGFSIADIKMIASSPQFVIIPPLVLFELIWIRMLLTRRLKSLRTNIIAILRKTDTSFK